MRTNMITSARSLAVVAALFWGAGCGAGTPEDEGAAAIPSETAVAAEAMYAEAVERLERFIRHEMRDKGLPALSIALVDDQEVVWAAGFGYQDPQDSIPATAETVYRVGSVSKLFTDIAVMRLVEAGELELDAPVRRYLPDFRPENPYDEPITLRHLMAHRSGLVREPPVGNYFDPTEPSLAATIASLNETRLVYRPGERTKYSNAAIATVGHVLERVRGTPFTTYVRDAVLDPLGMDDSAFEPRPDLDGRLATAYMWAYDGREDEAPTFQLGMAPAGSMYSTVLDLGGFLQALFAGGRRADERVLERKTLEAMWTPQFGGTEDGGFGIGFGLSRFDGHRRVGHGGAIYGFATELAALPDERIGAVAVTSVDIANTVVGRIVDAALRLMSAARDGEALRTPPMTEPIEPGRARRLDGRYGTGEDAVDLRERNGRLYMMPLRGGYRVELKAVGDELVADDRLAFGPRVRPLDGAIVVGTDTLRRVERSRPEPVPDRWRGLIGEYGWDHNTLYILEMDGRLYALIEWFFLYPLGELDSETYVFPDWGLYDGERLVFERDARGRATRVTAANVVFERRSVGAEDGGTFRIDPVAPIDELRERALAAEPPAEEGDFRAPDLVELTALDSTIRLDIRYATTNNFMGSVFYRQPRAFMQRPAAEAVVRAHRSLKEHGYGLLIYDAYRPWPVTKMFWDATPEHQKRFVANPQDGSRHNRGAAVDLTLYDLETGEPVAMASGYDEFTARAYPRYPGGTAMQRWHRELLRDAMEAQGFTVYEWEWWHFDYGSWREYPILDVVFEEIDGTARQTASAR